MTISNYILFKEDSNDVFWLMWSKSVRSDFFFKFYLFLDFIPKKNVNKFQINLAYLFYTYLN